MTDDELNRRRALDDGVTPELEAMLKEFAGAALRLGMISGAEREREGKAAPWVAAEFMAADARLGEACAALVAECRRLRDALGFYADPATYLAHGPLPPSQSSFEDPAIDLDRGRRARRALEGGAS